MPVRYITAQQGYRYGKTGHLYSIKESGVQGARVKAAKQGQAIEISRHSETQVRASKRARAHVREL